MPTGKPESTKPPREERAYQGDDQRVGPASASPPEVGQLERWAQLISDGEVSFPKDLSAEQTTRLEILVRAHHRERLVKVIARQIAKELAIASGR